MNTKVRILLAFTAALFLLGVMVYTLDRARQAASAAPATHCVAPGGTGCDPVTCGGTCFASVQAAVDGALTYDEIRVAGGTYTDIHYRDGVTQVLYINNSVTVRGGYNADLTEWDPLNNVSTLDAQRQGRVVYITGTVEPILEGFLITGGNATGLGLNDDCQADYDPDGCGGGIYVKDAHPLIQYNMIMDNIAAMVSVSPPDVGYGYGGGLYLYDADEAVIKSNIIISNTGTTVGYGDGGGLKMIHSDMRLYENQILNNVATTQDVWSASGGGISMLFSAVDIYDNLIQDNWANAYGGGRGGGLFQWYDYNDYYIGYNKFYGNHGLEAVYLGYSQAIFHSNEVKDNQTSTAVVLFGNDGSGGPSLVNNIIALNGYTSVSAEGFLNYNLSANLIHNTIVGKGFGYGILVDSPYVNLDVINNIIAGHTWGITNTYPTSSTLLVNTNLFWQFSHSIIGTYAVFGDPKFVDPNGDFHIQYGSAAMDIALPTPIIEDFDENDRVIGAGPDIGADEYLYQVFLSLVVR